MSRRCSSLAVTLIAATASCGGAVPAPDRGKGTCEARQLIVVNCSGCHDGVSESTGFLDLTAPDAIPALIGKPAAGPRCSGQVLIDSRGGGLFVDKLRSDPPCGDQMPQGTFPLSAEEIACVASWIATVAAAP